MEIVTNYKNQHANRLDYVISHVISRATLHMQLYIVWEIVKRILNKNNYISIHSALVRLQTSVLLTFNALKRTIEIY